MTPQEFDRQLEILSLAMRRGACSYHIWIELYPTPEAVEILNHHRDFFGPIRDALLASAVLELDKIFQRDPRAVSMVNLIRSAGMDRHNLVPHISEEVLLTLEKRVTSGGKALSELKQLRNRRVAHSDVKAPDGLSIAKGDLDRLYDDAISVFSVLESGRGISYASLPLQIQFSTLAAQSVLQLLAERRKRS